MGQWGVRSYENDLAADAIDAGMERVHAAVYEDLMDDRNRTPFEEVQATLANPATLEAAIEALKESVGVDVPLDAWDEDARLAFVGVVVRHAELGVPVPAEARARALDWLEGEAIEWDEQTKRSLRRQKELTVLKSARS
jgi:hypothetical protein